MGGLPVGEALDKLQHEHEREPPGGQGGLPIGGNQVGKGSVCIDGTEGIAHP